MIRASASGGAARPRFASAPSNDRIGLAASEDCRFVIFRADEQRMTSTLFAGGDWRWRLVTTGGTILAEAAGYPSESTCRLAVSILQKRAATAEVATLG